MVNARKRQIVKRVSLSACGMVLLVVSYLAAYGAFNWNLGKPVSLRTVFAPLHLYEATDYPGALALHAWRNWCLNQGVGSGLTWEENWQRSEENHKQIVQYYGLSRVRK
jgi:hypothetical protein